MRREVAILAILGSLLLAGCSQLERLTLIRPSAQHRGYTQIAPRYDFSGKHGRDTGDAAMLLAAGSMFFQRGQLDEAEEQARKALKAQHGWQEEEQQARTVNQTLIIADENQARKAIEMLK